MISIVVSVILGIYCVWLLVMLISWHYISAKPSSESNLSFSILVPFRNEQENLSTLIYSLSNLDYHQNQYEVILINDHSEDDFESQLKTIPANFKVINLPADKSGKKAALSFGVDHSKYDQIVTTDADCIVPSKWLKQFSSFFSNNHIKMVFGSVAFRSRQSIFHKLQEIEFAPLIGVGAASLNLGLPTMCNGANLAFRKEIFYEVGGYVGNENIASGDDEFLLSKIIKQYPRGVRFAKGNFSTVDTRPSQSLNNLFHQRKRWASKWSANNNWFKSGLAILIFLTSLSSVLGAAILISNLNFIILGLILFKVVLDGLFICQILKSMNKSFNFLIFILMQMIYPIYVLIFGITANIGSYQWKGRPH